MPQYRKHETNARRQAAYRQRQQSAYHQQLQQKGLPALPSIASLPGRARWNSALEAACLMLEQTLDEMQDYFDDRSEAWQESERAETMQEQIGQIQEALDQLRGVAF